MNYSKRERILVTLLGISVLLVSLVLFLSFGNYPTQEKEEEGLLFLEEFEEEPGQDIELQESEEPLLVIDVKGAVRNPGIYYVPMGSRVFEVIERAGGFLEEADQIQINLASVLEDEMLIYVPKVGEQGITLPPIENQTDGKVSLNKATQGELETLPGIGPGKAAAIIAYREENGNFEQVEDLLQVSGIGPKSFEKLKDQIKVD